MRKLTLILFLGPLAWVRLAANDSASDPARAWDQTIEQARTALTAPQTLRDQCPTPPINLSAEATEPSLLAKDSRPEVHTPHNGVLQAPEDVDPGILHKRLDQAPPKGAKRWDCDGGDFRVLQIAMSASPAPDVR